LASIGNTAVTNIMISSLIILVICNDLVMPTSLPFYRVEEELTSVRSPSNIPIYNLNI
jgi:hypothetical protein